jgi:transcriptional regulator with XRE-family HTH domain
LNQAGDMTDEELREWIRTRLAGLREGTGLTKEKFAASVGVSHRHINKLEDGDSSPTVEMLHNWLRASGTNLGLFFEPLMKPKDKQIAKENRAAHDGLDWVLAQPKRAEGVRAMMASFLNERRAKRTRKDN